MSLIDKFKATTPTQWRLAGKIFMRAAALIGGATFHSHPDLTAAIIVLCGVIGDFCFNLATEKEGKVDEKISQ
jgi:hypothetical protein